MEPTQQPVQAKPAVVQQPVATAQTQQKPVAGKVAQPVKPGQPTQPGQPIKKKPSKWWIWVLVAAVIIGGGIFAYFQFLA